MTSNTQNNNGWLIPLCALFFLLGFVAGYTARWALHEPIQYDVKVERDTTIIRDTIRLTEPKYIAKTIVRYDTIKVGGDKLSQPVTDFDFPKKLSDSTNIDSVVIPIEQKKYATEDYTAWVSGYKPALDSIEIFPKNSVVRESVVKENFTTENPKRWGIGVQVGYGVQLASVPTYGPYVGVGISYNLIIF